MNDLRNGRDGDRVLYGSFHCGEGAWAQGKSVGEEGSVSLKSSKCTG